MGGDFITTGGWARSTCAVTVRSILWASA